MMFDVIPRIGDRKGATKKLCDKDFAERSGELSGAIRLKTLVLLGNDPVTPPSNCSEILWYRSFDFLALWVLLAPEGRLHQILHFCCKVSENVMTFLWEML